KLSNGEEFDADTIVWSAGVKANPLLIDSDLPINERGNVTVRADLRVEGDDGVVEGAWAAGDNAAVPDLSGGGGAGFCVASAQRPVRQAPVLAGDVLAARRAALDYEQYLQTARGAVAGLGLYKGVSQMGDFDARGLLAWLMHRGSLGYAISPVDRKIKV